MPRVNKGSHICTYTFIHKQNQLYMGLLPSRKASLHILLVLVFVPLGVGGWVGLSGLVK